MTGTYKFIDHTADIAVEISADNHEDLLTAAASAWKAAAIESKSGGAKETKVISLEESSVEEILVGLLSELNYLLLTRKWVFESIKKISIDKSENLWNVDVVISGTSFDVQKHIIKVEIKAVTFHQMDVKFVNGKYKTRIVFDI